MKNFFLRRESVDAPADPIAAINGWKRTSCPVRVAPSAYRYPSYSSVFSLSILLIGITDI